MEAQPQPEPIRQRYFLFHRLGRVDGRATFVLDHVTGHQMPPVRRGIKHDILWPPLDPAIQHRLQRLVMRVIMTKAQIIAIKDKPLPRTAQQAQQTAHRWQVFTLQFHDAQTVVRLSDMGVHGFHKARLAHPARAPQQGVVGGQTGGELHRVGQQCVARTIHPNQQRQINLADRFDRCQMVRPCLPDKGPRYIKIRGFQRRRRHPLQRRCNTVHRVTVHFRSSSSSSNSARIGSSYSSS